MCPDELMPKQKLYEIRATNLIKEKWCRKIKIISCTYSISQRKYITKVEAAAYKVSMDSLLDQLMIRAFEERQLKIVDVPGAYLNSDMTEDMFIFLKLEY